jgi:Stage II sporulation protein M
MGRRVHRISEALRRARAPIAILALVSVSSLVVGGVLATSGNSFALEQRDAVVGAAQSSYITSAYNQGDRAKAALLDAAGNVEVALIASVTGLAVVGPLPIAAYRGWIGGIVSVDAQHRSRLAQPGAAFYYLVTVALQQIPFILTGGAGMYLGLVAWRRRNDVSVRPVLTLRIPGEALRDVGWIWALALPFFLAGSLFEFLQ